MSTQQLLVFLPSSALVGLQLGIGTPCPFQSKKGISGLKCFGHPVGATGLRMVYEEYNQLRGQADKRQQKEADIGLTQNLGGYLDRFTVATSIFGQRD